MKRLSSISIFILICIFFYSFSYTHCKARDLYIGTIIINKDNLHYYLKTNNGFINLGHYSTISNNKFQDCVDEASRSGGEVKIIGEMYRDTNNGDVKFLDDFYCEKYNNIIKSSTLEVSKDILSIYGISFDDAYDTVLEKALSQGFSVESTYVPDKFNNIIEEVRWLDIPPLPYDILKILPATNIKIDGLITQYITLWRNMGDEVEEFKPIQFDYVVMRKSVYGQERKLFIFFFGTNIKDIKIMSMVSNKSDEIIQVFDERYGSYKISNKVFKGQKEDRLTFKNGMPIKEIFDPDNDKYKELIFKVGNDVAIFNPKAYWYFYYNINRVKDFYSILSKKEEQKIKMIDEENKRLGDQQRLLNNLQKSGI